MKSITKDEMTQVWIAVDKWTHNDEGWLRSEGKKYLFRQMGDLVNWFDWCRSRGDTPKQLREEFYPEDREEKEGLFIDVAGNGELQVFDANQDGRAVSGTYFHLHSAKAYLQGYLDGRLELEVNE